LMMLLIVLTQGEHCWRLKQFFILKVSNFLPVFLECSKKKFVRHKDDDVTKMFLKCQWRHVIVSSKTKSVL
jgi:hypothetical protein